MKKEKTSSFKTGRALTVFMVATECRDLVKIGGLADVVRDLGQALISLGVKVRIILPYYEIIDKPAYFMSDFNVEFGTKEWPVQVYFQQLDTVPVYLIHQAFFFNGEYGKVYIDSNKRGRGPFEDDAKRFAFFSVAALKLIEQETAEQPIDVIHCHDWHTGTLLLLLNYDQQFRKLRRKLKTLFTIHNLDYQGVRPFELFKNNIHLSFRDWFPALYGELRNNAVIRKILQPGDENFLYNPIRSGINLADRVSTVSPTYAREIARPDDLSRNFIGGRGLESDLRVRSRKKELSGILNGLFYEHFDSARLDPPFDVHLKNWPQARQRHKETFLKNFKKHTQDLEKRLKRKFRNSPLVLSKFEYFNPQDWIDRPLVVAVTRAVEQKIGILLEKQGRKEKLVQNILKRELNLIIIGNGVLDEDLDDINLEPNAYFISAFDPGFANLLYISGDIFLMPSDFEPCGISQMIAMRYGCLPLVHDIGGLHDTVQHLQTGFKYRGRDRKEARTNLLKTLDLALLYYTHHHKRWQIMQQQAMQQRFDWKNSSAEYITLYKKMLGKSHQLLNI
jgi:starch synthase